MTRITLTLLWNLVLSDNLVKPLDQTKIEELQNAYNGHDCVIFFALITTSLARCYFAVSENKYYKYFSKKYLYGDYAGEVLLDQLIKIDFNGCTNTKSRNYNLYAHQKTKPQWGQ